MQLDLYFPKANDVVCACMYAKSLQLRLTLCDPMDCSPPGFSVHRILQARTPEWDLPDPGMEPESLVACIGRWILYY